VKKSWLLAGGAVVVVAAVVVLVVVLTSGADTSTPEGAAEVAVDAFGDKDEEALLAVLCTGAPNPLDQIAPPSPMVGADLGEVTQTADDEAVAKITITYTESSSDTEMGLVKENDEWCLAWLGG
jgi:hypothetical protein